eukprot:4582169-Alexandrium_andersonii.AAC.1
MATTGTYITALPLNRCEGLIQEHDRLLHPRTPEVSDRPRLDGHLVQFHPDSERAGRCRAKLLP